MSTNETLLSVRNLRTYFRTADGLVRAVDDVSFDIEKGRTFALVGESGCGKSVTAFSIMQLLQMPPAMITSREYLENVRLDDDLAGALGEHPKPAEILLEGKNLLNLPEKQMRKVRGRQVSMIFQEPMTSLNPVFTCGAQIVEAITLHQNISRREATISAIDMLDKVGIPAAKQRFDEYPHQLSGGMRQRVMIAMALSCNPKLLIADEPTTALDVTIQAQILELIKQIQDEANLAVMLITHDLAVVAETAHRVGVMYASKLVELADVETLFAAPMHPYTQGLFRSLPRLGERSRRLETIPGSVPNPLRFSTGCKFHPRCPIGRDDERCRTEEPSLREVGSGHWVACWNCLKGNPDNE